MYIENQIPSHRHGEKLVLFLRRHLVVLGARFLIVAALAIIPVAFYFYLTKIYPWIFEHAFLFPALLLLASSYYLFIILFLYNTFIDYYLDVWIVTDQRIINIEQRGMFNREIAEHDLDKIQDVSGIQKGFFSTVFSFGDVHVQTAGEIQRFIFRQVDNPFEIVKTINKLIQAKQQDFDNRVFAEIKEKRQAAE
jgi:hypothetical protein